jgi:hypothetical protein
MRGLLESVGGKRRVDHSRIVVSPARGVIRRARRRRSTRRRDADCSGRRDGADVTIEELVVAVERHRLQMAPLMAGLADVVEDDASRQLVGLLEDSDRELDRLCHRLSQLLRRLDEPTGRQQQWT